MALEAKQDCLDGDVRERTAQPAELGKGRAREGDPTVVPGG